MSHKLKAEGFCDGCPELIILPTISQHRQCKKYKINMLPSSDTIIMTQGKGSIIRPDKCKVEFKDNEIHTGT